TTVSVDGGREIKIPNRELADRSVEVTGGSPREQPPRRPVMRHASPQMPTPPPQYQESYPPQYEQGYQEPMPPFQPPYQPPGQPSPPPGRPPGRGSIGR
ncbi:MAG: hypothetical protein M3Y58_10025, partial [Chloroflexota bacterium]|nr:hypothetical protein [Chloroflexota bacterium]